MLLKNIKKEIEFLNLRMVAEQTAAYQKQLWMSQLQITNPQAYQVIRLFCSLLISFSSFRPLESFEMISLSLLLLSWSQCPKG